MTHHAFLLLFYVCARRENKGCGLISTSSGTDYELIISERGYWKSQLCGYMFCQLIEISVIRQGRGVPEYHNPTSRAAPRGALWGMRHAV